MIFIFFSREVSALFFEPSFQHPLLNSYLIQAALAISIFLTVFEAISSRGLDNLTVPIMAALLIFIFLREPNPELLNNFTIGIILSFIVAFISYKLKFLINDGSAATFLLAGLIFGFGGLKWSIPILTFFILSSILSKVRKASNKEVETYFEKTGTRDSIQVAANGGIGGILVLLNIFYSSEILYLIYLACFAAVCADTWSTEIGTLKKAKTYNIINFKQVQQGISGGVSFRGSIGALFGAFAIALSGLAWTGLKLHYYLLLIVLSGLLGSLLDSILGATIQAQYECGICRKKTERKIHCGDTTKHVHGFIWLNNDMVNFFASISGGIFLLIMKSGLL